MLHKKVKPSINISSSLVQRMNGIPDQPLLIHPPRKALVRKVLWQWLALFLLIYLSVGFFIYITAPLISIWIFQYFKHSIVWGVYRYSRLLLHTSTILLLIAMVIFTVNTRFLLLELFR